jgi:tetratricopeptide (TPR) repeat protein
MSMRPRFHSFSLLVALGALASASAGCGAEPRVVRVYDGQIVEGRYVSPEAYAAFLRGVLAEESGDLKAAVAAYGVAVVEDEDDPELMSRIGEARCKLDPKDALADRAFDAALKTDPTSATALAAKGRCALARGRTDEAFELASRAAAQDPKNVGLEALVVRAGASRTDPAARERAIALTLAHGENSLAWDALIVWGRAHRDAELVTRGLEGLVRVAPARSLEAERGVTALLEGGDLVLARRLACAVSDAPREMGVIGPRDPTVARLAVDEALLRGDRAVALARATRGHVSLAEVAARALLLDKKEIATSVAASVADADPGASGAVMVRAALSASGPGAGRARADLLARITDQPPEICAFVFADRLGAAAGPEVAKQWLGRITRTPMAARDPLGGRLAKDLADRGILPVADLPVELRAASKSARASE